MGLDVAIITGGKNETIKERYMGLGITDIFMGVSVKIDVFEEYITANGLKADEVLYMGDDIPDFEVMRCCGCPCCPKDAVPEIKAISIYVSEYSGGKGCVRDVVEQVLRAKNLWMHNSEAFGW